MSVSENRTTIPMMDDSMEELACRASLRFFALLTGAGAAAWAAGALALGLYVPAAIPLLYLAICALNLYSAKLSGRYRQASGLQALSCIALPACMQALLGGMDASGGVAFWSGAALAGTATMRGTRLSFVWLAVFLALIIGLLITDPYLQPNRPPQLVPAVSRFLLWFNLASVPTVVYLLARSRFTSDERFLKEIDDDRRRLMRQSEEIEVQQQEIADQTKNLREANKEVVTYAEKLLEANKDIKTKQKDVEAARARADELLYNIFPESVADELKKEGHSKPRYYGRVTVVFSDYEGFTKIAEEMSPEEIVEILGECFNAFDEIVERYGLEKIKTLGDGYMCAAGLPKYNANHAIDAVGAALEMKRFTQELNEKRAAAGLPTWRIRMGIHSGSVVAGVIGKKKFLYDIWGDAVNVASRLEQHGEIDHINISGDTYRQVKHLYHCFHKGRLAIRNKGEIDTYIVEGRL